MIDFFKSARRLRLPFFRFHLTAQESADHRENRKNERLNFMTRLRKIGDLLHRDAVLQLL